MCGPPYDREYGVPNISNAYTIQNRLDMYYNYQRNHKSGETEEEYSKRICRNQE